MASATFLDASLKRLSSALDQLEAAWERRAALERRKTDLEDSLLVLQDDRSRLAVELDGALSRARSLEQATAEVSRRLQGVGTAIQTVLAKSPPDGTRSA